jgi:phosphomannomutase
MPIRFGTDGWRGVIAEEFTFENVRLCAQGTAELMKQHGWGSRGLVVGYDTRFASAEFASAVAEVTAANGIHAQLCDRAAPTPVVSYSVVSRDAGAGVVITASHNPPQWNGFKFKPDYGGSASPQVAEELERHIARAEASGTVARMTVAEARDKGLIELFDPRPAYLDHIANLVDLEGIRRAGLKMVVDPMFGAGAGYLVALLGGGSTEVTEIRGERNPAFPGMSQPEPLARNLGILMSTVGEGDADIGLATDGDADRLGIVDERGRFVTSLECFALLCLHQLEVLKRRGPLVRSITMTSMIDRLGEIYGVPVFDTPVGFKYLGPTMMREDALMAGEESGGYAFRGNIPERDGILSGLMVLDMMVKTRKTVSELLRMLTEKVGPHHYHRWDLKYEPATAAQHELVQERMKAARPSALAGRRVERIDTQDGFRYVLEGGYWALVRFSGTEPLLRIYAEGATPQEVNTLLEEARAITGL